MKTNLPQDAILAQRIKQGLRLREIRINRGLTQAMLAEKIGTIQQTIGKIERGKWAFSIDVVIAMAHYLNFEIEFTEMPERPEVSEQPDQP